MVGRDHRARRNEERIQSQVKRRLLVRRGATDPLFGVCRNRRFIINRSGNEAPVLRETQVSKAMNIAEGVRRGVAREEIGGPA